MNVNFTPEQGKACLEIENTELRKENQRLNNDIKVLLKENEAKEKVIIKQDNILNALEESYIEDIEKLESFGIERQVEIAEIISCYKFYLRRLRELKESDK